MCAMLNQRKNVVLKELRETMFQNSQGIAKVCPRMFKSLTRSVHETLKDQRHSHHQKENSKNDTEKKSL